MKKKILIISVIFVIAIAAFFVVYKNNNYLSAKTDDSMILYVQDGCPHCAVVEEYIKTNNIASKISFVQKNITSNPINIKDLLSKIKACGLSADSAGTPFLWDKSKCFIGDQDIIEFFKSNINS